MRIEVLSRAQLDDARLHQLAEWIAAANAQPEQHIGYLDVEPVGVTTELRELAPGTVLAVGTDEWGALAAEWDAELGRTWLYGPYLHLDDPQWAERADELYAAVRSQLPAGVTEHEVFFDSRNDHLDAFAARHGFRLQGEHAIYVLDRDTELAAPTGTEPLPLSHEGPFAALHASAFPRTHASATTILAGERHFLRPTVILDDTELLGYAAVTVEPANGAANLEYIAVSPVRQGLGVGARLLSAAAGQAFAHPAVKALNLTVSTTNVVAIRVYEKAGFVRERTMRAYRTSR